MFDTKIAIPSAFVHLCSQDDTIVLDKSSPTQPQWNKVQSQNSQKDFVINWQEDSFSFTVFVCTLKVYEKPVGRSTV